MELQARSHRAKKFSVYAGVYNVDYCKYLYDIRKELLLLNRNCYLQSR